jgi:DUF1680 family protein
VAQLPGLIYAQQGDTVFVNLYVDSEADVKIGGTLVHIRQKTNYPWDGQVSFDVGMSSPATSFTLKLRVPGWAGDRGPLSTDLYTFSAPAPPRPPFGWVGEFAAAASRDGWVSVPVSGSMPTSLGGAPISMALPMPVRRVLAHANVKDDTAKAAIQRGPLVYALEGVDNGGKVLDLSVPLDAAFAPAFKADLLGGVTTLTTTGTTVGPDGAKTSKTVTAVPYFAWANRGRGEMAVWVKY